MFKNVASQKIQLFAFDTTTGAPKTGDSANITAYVQKDHGAVTVLGDTSATEADATNAKGCYTFDLTQAETNADTLAFTAKSSTANVSITPILNMQTFPPSFGAFVTPTGAAVNTTQLAGQTVTAAAGVTFPTSVASPTNITAGTITTATNVTTVNGLAAGVITNASIAANAISDAKVDPDVTIASVTGAVGSVTGNVGGNVTGSVGSVVGAVGSVTGAVGSVTARVTANTDQLAGQTVTAAAGVTFPTSVASPTNITAGTITTATNVTTVNGLAANVITAASIANDAITAGKIATDAIDADALAADAVTEIQSGLSTLNAAGVRSAVGLASANLDTQLDALPTAAENADAVWDEAIAGHAGAGSTGEALGAAGAAGDPWITALPGAYTAGQAGYIVGTNVNATISSRATQTSVDDVPTNAELATALGTADDAVLAAIGALPQDKTGYALTSAYDFAKGTVAMTEAYAADGATITPAQAFYMIWSLLAERGISGTTLTAKKLDGSTTSMSFTLDDATSPTSQTRSA